MKTLQIPEETYNFLVELSKELNSQDNRCTADPYFFQVQDQERVVAAERCGTEAWYIDDTEIETEEEINETIAEYKDIEVSEVEKMRDYEKEKVLEEIGYQKYNYEYKNRYQNVFLTAKACDQHINGNRHHYNEPVSYLTHAFRNPELEQVIKFIKSLTK